jgi:hypothetical protein
MLDVLLRVFAANPGANRPLVLDLRFNRLILVCQR